MTVKPKPDHRCFGGKKTDEKSGKNILGPFSIQPIILFFFVLSLLLLEWLLSENAVVGNLVGQFWSILRQNSFSIP